MGLGLGLGLDKPKGLIYFQNQFSMEFDGSDDRIFTDGADTVAQPTTYSFWCKSSEGGTNNGVFGHGSDRIGAFHFNRNADRPQLFLGTNYLVIWNDTSAQDDGEWHHWVVYSDTNDITNSKLYVDGVLQSQSFVDSSGSLNSYTESLTIGSDRQSGGNSFLGSMDEFAVFDRELTQAEITRMYNTYYTNNLVKNGNFEEIGVDVIQNGDFEQIGGEEVDNGSFSEIGNEEVTDGDFPTGTTAWSFSGGGIEISNGKLNFTSTTREASQSISIVNGKTYKVTYEISDYNTGDVRIELGSSNGISRNANGIYTEYIVSTGTSSIQIDAVTVFTGSIDNVSVKEVGQDWTFFGEAEFTSLGARIYSSSGGQSYIKQTALTNTKNYKLTYEITDSAQGSLKLINVNGLSDFPISSTVGTHTVYFTANNNEFFIYRNSGVTDVTIDNISVKEVGQNWTFGTGWSIGSGLALYTGTTNASLSQPNALISGRTYKLQYEVISSSLDGIFKISGGTAAAQSSLSKTVGIHNINFTADGSAPANMDLRVVSNTTGTLEIDNIVVQEVGQNWTLLNGSLINTDLATVVASGSISSTGTNWSLNQPNVFSPSKSYRIKFRARQTSGSGNFNVGYSWGLIFNQVITSSFVDYTVDFTTTSNGWENTLTFGGYTVGDTFEVDNIVVQQQKHQATNLLVNSGDYQSANPLLTSTKSMEFSGIDDYLEVQDDSSLQLEGSAASWTFWTRLDSLSGGDQKFIAKAVSAGSDLSGYQIRTDNADLLFQSNDGGWYGVTASSFFTDLNWVNVTITLDSSNLASFYKNGILFSSGNLGIDIPANTGEMLFGARTPSVPVNFLDGDMTEVGIYNRCLTALEVTSLYNQGMPTNLLVNRNNYQSGNPTVFNTKQVDFDGIDDYMELGSQSATSSLTYSAWVNVDANTSNVLYYGKTIFRCNTTTELKYWSDVTQSNITLTVDDYFNKWTHFVVTQTGTTYTIYQNGIQKGTGTVAAVSTTQDNSYIGRFSTQYFNGQMSQVGIWNTTLTADEVSSLYNHGLPIDLTTNQAAYESSSNLVGYWRMGSGTLDSYPLIADQTNATLGVELSPNTDFTSNITGWQGYSSGTASWNSFNEGSMKLVSDGTNHWFAQSTSPISGIEANSTYIVTAKVYLTSGYAGGDFYIYDAGQFASSTEFQVKADKNIVEQWQDIKYILNTSSDTAGRLYFRSLSPDPNSGDTVYVDDVTIKKVQGNPAIMSNTFAATAIENGSPYANLIQNNDFSLGEAGYWNVGTHWDIANGVATCDGLQTSNNNLYQVPYIVGKTYKTQLTVNAINGTLKVFTGTGAASLTITSAGTYDVTTEADSSTVLYIQAQASSSMTIDNVTVEEVNTGLQGYWKMGDGTNDKYPIIYDQTNPTLSAEKIINGDFSNGTTDWFVTGGSGATISIDNGRLKIDGSSGATAEQTVTAIIGKTYKVTYDLTLGTATSGATIITGGNYPTLDAPEGTNIFYSVATSTSFRVRPRLGSNGTMFVDNISVKEVQGNPAIMTSMPEGNITNQYPLTKLRNYYRMGDGILDSKFLSYPATAAPFIFQDQTSPNLAHIPTTNLVTYSEDTSQWTDSGITYSVDYIISPDGTLNASKAIINDTITSSNTRPMTSVAVTSGTNYVFSVFGKADEFDMINLDFSNTAFSTVSVDYNLTNGTVTSFVGSPVSQGVEDYGNGWYRCYVVATAIATTTTALIIRLDDNPTGDGTSGLYLWGAQAEQQSQATTYLKSDGVASVRKSSTTNLVEYSEDFSQSSWLNINSVALANNVAIAPNGTQTASTLTSTSPSAFQYLKSNIVVSSSTRYTVSVFVKKETTQTLFGGIGLDFTGGTRQVSYAIFDAVNGTINISGYSTNVTSNVVSYNEDWWRIQVNASSNSGNNSLSVSYYGTLSTNGTSVGTGIGSARTIWGYQLEEQTQAETYAPTKGIPVTIDLFKENNYGHTQGGVIQKDVPRNS